MPVDTLRLNDIAGMKQRLLLAPDTLHKARTARAEAQGIVTRLKDQRDEIEAETAVLVGAERDAANKPAFSNAELRAAETKRRLSTSADYGRIASELAFAENDKTMRELEVQRLEDEQRSWRAVVDLTIAEINLVVAGR
jgi:hypothetical protein